MVVLLASASMAQAAIPDSLKSSCLVRTPHPGYSFQYCSDGTPAVSGRTPNIGGVKAVTVPAKYDGWEGLPAKSADAASSPGADPDGNIALDVDISLPTTPAPAGGYPLITFMHGCCNGTKTDWERNDFEGPREHWHNNNAWFAARGYVVINYTSRGFHSGPGGSTGETQLDSRLYEINDFQSLAGQVADDPFFNVNPQKIVATGGSYGGGFSWLALTDPIWNSPAGKPMRLAAVAPRYGWTDIIDSLLPNGRHSSDPAQLPAFDGSTSTSPFGIPKLSINNILYGTGLFGATFPPSIDRSFRCLLSAEPYESNPLCADVIAKDLPEFINDRSAYYQNAWFERIASDPAYRIPIFSAGTLTDPLFPAVEHLRMSNRIRSVVPDYPIEEYYGDYEHFTQNKAKEWGDLCGADHHVCRFADYPNGDLNAAPAGLVRTGVSSRMNRFIDHYAQPASNPNEPQPPFDVTAALQICPQNASAQFPADEPGERFTAPTFAQIAPYHLQLSIAGEQTTVNDASPNTHATQADPINNIFSNGSACPVTTTPAGPGVATYTSEPLAQDATMVGGTKISIDYAATTTGIQLNTRMYDVFPDGTAVMVDRGPFRATAAAGTATYQLHGNGWRFPAGHRIRVEVAQDDGPYLKPSEVVSSATLSGVRLVIPVREPQRGDFRNAAKFCAAEQDFYGDAEFGERWGTNKNARNAFGKCVSRSNHA
jgi:hypothetical protein